MRTLLAPKPRGAPARCDLTRWPRFRNILQQRALNWIVMTVAGVAFLLAIAAGLLGTAAGSANFGIVFVWIVWWGLLMGVLLPLGGRLWCFLCPIPAPGEWLQRKALVDAPGNGGGDGLLSIDDPERPGDRWALSRGRRWPSSLRGIWLQNAGFLGVALFSTVILTMPSVTGWVLLAFLAGAVGLAVQFERRAFCRYVCPVGGFIGLYSMVSPLELRVRDPLVCQDHRTKDCYLGNAEGYGCPWLEKPWSMDRNAYCGLCGECLRTCTKDNVAVNLRLPGSDLLVAHGWKLDEAYKAFIMLACAAIYPVVFLGPWGWLKEWANLDTLAGFGLYALGFLGLNLAAVPALHLGTAALTRWTAGLRDVPLQRLFVALAYSLVPLSLTAWIAFTVSLVFANLAYALPVLSDPFGWGWNLLGTRHYAWRPWLTGWVPSMQAALLIAGLIGSIVAAEAILWRFHGGRVAIRGVLIQAITLTAETAFLLWLYLGASA
ncbi:MAG: 4Fe-4S binding protein [candidate division NC10 bacterium]|nr:4Fe-4S binding protein [candidate division NC10 bacterium]